MPPMNIELCPETGICSIIKPDGTKIDLMPDEVDAVRDANGKSTAVRQALAEVDADFAAALAPEELQQVCRHLG